MHRKLYNLIFLKIENNKSMKKTSILEIDGRVEILETRSGKYLREIFFIIYIIFTLTYSGLIAYFLGSSILIFDDLKNSSSNNLVRDMIYVWKNNYIINDITLTSTSKCPIGYNLAYEYQWPGMISLCNCPSVKNGEINYSASYGNCSDNQIKQNCSLSPSRGSQNLNKWRNSKKLCVKYGSTTFFSLPAKCDNSSDFMSCGQGETQICVSTKDSCPISSMLVSSISLQNDQSNSLSLDSTYRLYYKYDADYFPIAFFKISNTFFCAFHNRDYSPSQSIFLLSSSNANFDCSILDESFKIIDEIGELDFNTINNLTNYLNLIPSYPKPTNEYTKVLGSRAFQYWSYTCRNNDEYNLGKVDDIFSLTRDSLYQVGLIIVTIISLVITGLILPIIDLSKRYIMGPEKRAEAKVLKAGTLILDKFFRFLVFPLIILCYIQVSNEKKWLIAVEDYKCSSDFFINKIKKPHFNALNDLAGFYGNMLALWVLMVIFDIIYLTVRFLTDRKKEIIKKPKIAVCEETKPLYKNQITPEISEKATPAKNDRTDLEDNLVEEGDIKKLEQEIQKTIKTVNLPSKAEIKVLEMELKDFAIGKNSRTKDNTKSQEYLVEEFEEKKSDEGQKSDEEQKFEDEMPRLKGAKKLLAIITKNHQL